MSYNKNNNNNRGNRNIKIDDDAKEFARLSFKKYKKHNDYFDSKKELKESYNMYLIDLLPRTIEFIVKYGYIKSDEVQEIKALIYEKLVDEDFVKALRKEIKNDNKINNIKLYPIIIKDILALTERENKEILAKDPNAKIYDMSDLAEISQMILKKKMKKMEKKGIDANIAFDVLSIIPTEKALSTSQNYRIHILYDCLYEHSKAKAIPFNDIMDILVTPDYFPVFIAFALLERKEKFANLTDSQKTFYLQVSTWIFDTMEKRLSRDEVLAIIKTFISTRKRDEANNKDSNRRYALSTLSEDDYPKINKIIRRMMSEDESIKKYL